MDQETHIPTTRPQPKMDAGSVLCRIRDQSELEMYAEQYEPLAHIGFTGVTGPERILNDAPGAVEKLTKAGFTIHADQELKDAVDLSTEGFSAGELWTMIDARPQYSRGVILTGRTDDDKSRKEAMTLLQMSTSPVPIVPVSTDLIYSSALREQRELLRSLVFWRKRFDIVRHTPRLVHAGDDGLLIFINDSWLVTVNNNPEEASIDLGSHGSMWLMLGTQRDVHLHGSMLILPAHSGAVVANELAR